MNAWWDFFPIVAFFIADHFKGLMVATAVLVIATLIQVGVQYYRDGRVHSMLLIGSALVLIFGGLTLYTNDLRFLLWKPSVVYVVLALAFYVVGFDGRQSLPSKVLASQMIVHEYACERANRELIGLFLLMAVANGIKVSLTGQAGFALWLIGLKTIGVLLMLVIFVRLAQGGTLLEADTTATAAGSE